MKTGSICPACFQGTLTQVVGVGIYWHCLNRVCGQTFLPEKLCSTGSADAISDGNVGLTEDHLEAKIYRIPTTVAGQVYELRRLFRQ